MITNKSYIETVKKELLNNKFGMTNKKIITNYLQNFNDEDTLEEIKKDFKNTFESICNKSEERKEKILEVLEKTDSIFDYSIVEFVIDNFPKYMHVKYGHKNIMYMFALVESEDDLYYIGVDENNKIYFITCCAILEETKNPPFNIKRNDIENIKKQFEDKLEESDKILYMDI